MKPVFRVYIFGNFIAPSMDSVPLAQKKLYLISPGVIIAISRANTPRKRINQLLAGHRRSIQLSANIINHLRRGPSQIEQTISTEAVDELPTENIVETLRHSRSIRWRPNRRLRLPIFGIPAILC